MIPSTLVLLAVSGAVFWCSWSAARHRRNAQREVDELALGIEERAADDGPPATKSAPIALELAELLDAVIVSNARNEAIVAVNEITSRASLARLENRTLSRGLPKIALSAGVAGAFGLAALHAFDGRGLLLALGSFALGFLGSISARVSLNRGRKEVLRYVNLAETLADQVRVRWSRDGEP